MKVQMNIIQLINCFNNMQRIISNKNVNDVYKYIQFVFMDGILYLYTSNGIQHAKVIYGDVEHAENVQYFIEFNLLNKFIKSLDKEEIVEFNFLKNKLSIEIESNKYNFSYYISDIDFDKIFKSLDVSDNKILEIEAFELSNIIYKLSPCINTETTNSKYKGIYYNGDFASTDSFSCSLVITDNNINDEVFIAYDGIKILSNILKSDEKKVSLYNMPNYVIAKTNNSSFILNKLTTIFPKYKVALSKIGKHDNFFTVETSEFTKLCKRMILFSDKTTIKKVCELIIEDNVVRMKTELNNSSDGGKEAECIVPTNYVKSTGNISFLVDIVKLSQYVSVALSNTVTITYALDVGPGSPFAIKSEKDEFTGHEGVIHIEGVLTKRKI